MGGRSDGRAGRKRRGHVAWRPSTTITHIGVRLALLPLWFESVSLAYALTQPLNDANRKAGTRVQRCRVPATGQKTRI
jgi:hypothetical protein